jgi:hypothetical protein
MRSPESARRGAVALLLVAVTLFSALAAWSLAVRSTIPMALDGTVTGIETRHEKHPGVDDVWLVAIDGNQRHLDTEIAKGLSVGDHIEKVRWDTRLEVNGESRSLHLSNDSRAMLFLAPILSLTAAVLAVPSAGQGLVRRVGTDPRSPEMCPLRRPIRSQPTQPSGDDLVWLVPVAYRTLGRWCT